MFDTPARSTRIQGEIYFDLGIGTRMRRLMEMFTADTDRIYSKAGLTFRVSYFYAMYALVKCGPLTIADIAKLAGFSHSAVSQTIKRMTKENLVEAAKTDDGRQKLIRLTQQGITTRDSLIPIWAALESAMGDAMNECGFDLLATITALEQRFHVKSLYDRIQDKTAEPTKAARPEIVPFHTSYRQAYHDLNVDWMATMPWNFEEKDIKSLLNPEHRILDEGGEIFFALVDGKPVGTLTMKRVHAGTFELAKLVVSDTARGLGAGIGLCEALTDRFVARGGVKLFLETNSTLTPAIELYKRVGFKEFPVPHRSYDRTDFYMEWQPREKAKS
ncbi:MAG: bifunctional helix-turn-helix transcriptional regulator/GNAT family N-acetyltransferase [Kordiimonadaceae bacterium]|nr:bifunctional helix-turn-helix transcriptional regulator/GNAT family N-acetyltransferase [Kordiimonadaceae bacterium]